MIKKFKNIGIILFIIFVFILLYIDSANAFVVYSNNNVTIDESYIYNGLSHFSEFNLQDYSNIDCEVSTSSVTNWVTCSAIRNDTFTTLYKSGSGTGYVQFKSNLSNTEMKYKLSIKYDITNDTLTYINNSKTNNIVYLGLHWASNDISYTNYNPSQISGNSDFSRDSTMNKLDFSQYLRDPYISIDYLDNQFNSINNIKCDELTDYCTLNVNSSNGKYIKVTYYSTLYDNIDYLPNSDYIASFELIGSNTNVPMYALFTQYYYNDSTSNIANDTFLRPTQDIVQNGNTYTYNISWKSANTGYTSQLIERIAVYYDFGSTNISSVSVPFRINQFYGVPSGTLPSDSLQNQTQNNYNQAIVNNLQNIINQAITTNQNLTNINNSINNDNVDLPNNSLSQANNQVASNNVVSNLISLPITLFQKILNSLNGTCSAFSLGSLYNTNLTIPCINLQNYLGSTLYNVIDILISGIFVYVIGRKMIDIFNHLSQLKDGDLIK